MTIVRFSGFNERRLERFAWAVLLQSIGEGEGIVHLVVLEDIEAAIQGDFPAVVGHDMAGMNRAAAIEFPSEVHAHAACGLLHLLEVFLLLFAFELALRCHQMHGNFSIRSLVLDHGLQEFHEVAHLVKQADVWIGDCDRGRTLEIGAEQHIEGDALLVLLDYEVLFLEDGLGRCQRFGWQLG